MTRPFLRSVSRRSAALTQLLLFVFSLSTSLLPCSDPRVGGSAAHHPSPSGVSHHIVPVPTQATSHDAAAHHLMVDGAATHDMATHDMATHDMAPAQSAPANESPASDNALSCPLMIGCSGIVQFADDLEWHTVVSPTPTDAPTGLVLARAIVDLDVDSPPPRR